MAFQQWLSDVGDLAQRLRPYLINLIVALLLLLVGTFICRFLEVWSRRAAQAAVDKAGGPGASPRSAATNHLAQSVPRLVGRFVYWLAFFLFAMAAIEMLDLPVATRVANQITSYLPGAFIAIAIVFVGFIVASLVGGIAAATFASRGASYAGAVGRAVQGVLVVLAVLVGMEQVGIHGELLIVLLSVIIGVILCGAALAFGLGARTAVSNIVASYYVAQIYRVGQTVRVGEFEGRIVRTTSTAVILDTRNGQVLVPARLFSEQPSVLVTEIT